MNNQELTAKKLQTAINMRYNAGITIHKSQKYNERDQKTRNFYSVKQDVWNERKGKMVPQELFSACSILQVVLFLRDYWYILNDWELPNDNPMWNDIRERKLGDFYVERGKQDPSAVEA